MTLLAYADAVDIGHGRGRLAPTAAASLARVDTAIRDTFSRHLDINEAWRSPEKADANYRAYQAYLNGGPWAPLALPAKDSIHCRGYAIDTDDGYYPAAVRILNDHGWFHTVFRWVNGRRVLIEPWHLEYDPSRDNHRNDPAPASSTANPLTTDPRRSNVELKINEAGTVRLFTDNGDVEITSILVRNLLIRHRNQSFEPTKLDGRGNPILPQFLNIELDLIATAIRAADDGSAANLAELQKLTAEYERVN